VLTADITSRLVTSHLDGDVTPGRRQQVFTMLPRVLPRLLKTLLLVLLVMFLLTLLHDTQAPSARPGDSHMEDVPASRAAELPSTAPSAALMNRAESVDKRDKRGQAPRPEKRSLAEVIAQLNAAQTIRTPDGTAAEPLVSTDVVVVVQVHKRLDYLRQLIQSLRAARGIDHTLVIFSHDVFDEEVNRAVGEVDFCRVMQIFYPYSLQLHNSTFPGRAEGDCPHDVSPARARRLGCTSWRSPDRYGHYRQPGLTQIKHHWWWKAKRVFDQLEYTRHHPGLFLFIEEDHYVPPDFLHMLAVMQAARKDHCPQCNVLSLGAQALSADFRAYRDPVKSAGVYLTPWTGYQGLMAFDRRTWKLIHACATEFCTFDDYNWDWSLQHLSRSGCTQQPLYTMLTKAPRVFHVGECGVHNAGDDCDKFSLLNKIKVILDSAKSLQFPKNLTQFSVVDVPMKRVRANGGWGDPRDHVLCITGRLPQTKSKDMGETQRDQVLESRSAHGGRSGF